MHICAEIGEDAAGVSILQSKTHLYAHEPHAEVDDGAHTELRLVDGKSSFRYDGWIGLHGCRCC